MSELTTGGINFGYQSPISQIYKDVEYKFKEDMENKIMEAVHHFGISVDKEELIKALQYDRNQYEKGYSDGRASIVGEFERLRAEIDDLDRHFDNDYFSGNKEPMFKCNEVFEILDKKITELKGE